MEHQELHDQVIENTTHLKNIHGDITEIKTDIKTILTNEFKHLVSRKEFYWVLGLVGGLSILLPGVILNKID